MLNENQEKAVLSVKKHINSLGTVAAVIADPLLGNQLTTKFSEMYSLPLEEANRFYAREKDNFGKMISQSPALQACTPMSAYLAFGRVMALKLTFDNGRYPLIYLIPGNRNVGTKENPNWVSEMVAQPSPEGEKEARINTGILKKVGQPIIVHEGDHYRKFLDDETGQIKVEYAEAEQPSTKIRGSFIRLVENDGTVVFKTFSLIDIKTWMDASAKKNRGTANALYTAGIDGQIQEAFLKGKTTLHSFKGYKQVDYGSKPQGFVPDVDAAKQINANYSDDLIEYTETNVSTVTEETDFTPVQVIEEKKSVTVEVDSDDAF